MFYVSDTLNLMNEFTFKRAINVILNITCAELFSVIGH